MSGTLQLAGCTASTFVSSPSATRHNALLIPEKLWLKGPQQEPVWQPQQIVYRGPIKPAMLKAEANRSYSWWWDSHVSPKNSRWLQENLTDMDMKVKAMLKLIEEDADSFAQRAEMYYKKRPELVNLVEEFYRAYRALAERYDHISGELRQVHYSMAEASPTQIQSLLHGDSPRAFAMTEAGNQYFENRQTAHSFNDADELLKETSDQQRGLHFQMHKKTGSPFEKTEASNEATNLQGLQQISEISLQYRDPEKMALSLQEELQHVKEENQKIKEVSSSQVEQINGLKGLVLSLKEQNKDLEQEGNALRLKLQTETQELQKLKKEIQNLEVALKKLEGGNIEKLKGIQYEDVTREHGVKGNEISGMHNEISQLQQENHRLSVQVMTGDQQLEKAQKEALNLHEAFLKSHAEQEAMVLQYQESRCLYQNAENRMNDLQGRISLLQEENKRLKDELSSGILRFKIIEERAQTLERDKKALQQEMEHRAQKTSLLQEELTGKHKEEKNLIIRLQEETACSRRTETALKTCQQALSQSQEQQKILTGELQVGIERLKDANTKVKKLEEEITQHRKENDNLLKQISSAVMSVKNLEEENSKLKQEKSTLLNEVAFRVDQRNALQQELYCLQEERNALDRKFQIITKQIEPLGIDVERLRSHFTSLQNDNQKLREDCHKCEEEKVSMAKIAQKKEEELIERKHAVENIVSSHKAEVERLEDKMKQLELLFHGLQEEKTSLMLANKQHTEQVKVLAASLQNVNKLNSQLEGENLYLNGELTDALWHVKQLKKQLCSLQSEKEATESEIAASAIQVSDLEQKIHLLQEGGKDLMTRLQEETEKQNKSQIELENLQQLLCQLEDRIKTQSDECQEHIGEYRSAVEKVTELEKVIHIQQKEIDSLLNDLSSEIKLNMELKLEMVKLRDLLAIPDIAEGQLEGADVRCTKLLNSIFDKIKSLQRDHSHTEEENKRLLNEALVSSTCLEQFKMNMSALLSENESLEAQAAIRSQHFEKTPKETPELQDITEALRIKLQAGIERERKLKMEMKSVQQSLVTSQGAYLTLQDEHQRTVEECNSAKKQIDDLRCSHSVLKQEGQIFLTEALTQINLVSILESISVEKDEQIQISVEQLKKLHEEKEDLESRVQNGDRKVQMLEVETLQLQEAIDRLQEHKRQTDVLRSEFKTLSEECEQMNIQIQAGNHQVKEKDKMLHKLRQQLQAVQEDNARLVRDFESVKEEYVAVEMTVKELQKQMSLLTEETIHLNAEVSVGRKDRAKLEEELDNLQCQKQLLCDKLSSSVINENKLQNDVMQLQEQREHSRNQLQKQTIEVQILEVEAERLYESLLSSQIENTLLKDENQKITDVCKSLERRTRKLQEEVLSMEQEKRKHGIEEVARVAQIKGLQGMIADLQTERKVIGAKAASMFIVTAAVKENVSALKEQVLAQIKAREADSQKLQDHLLRWLQDDVGKLQEANGELSTEAESKARELQKLQSEIHAIQQIVIELEGKNLILKDESERRIKEHCDATTRIQTITNEKAQLESENRLLKEELDRAEDEALQLQEEGTLLKDDLQLQVTEVEALKAKLDNARQVAMHVARLLEMIIGSEQQHESLSTATFQFAEEKLKQIYHVLLCLKDENERLKDDASQMAAKVDKLEDVLCMRDNRSILDEPTQSHVHNSNLQQDGQQFEAKNCTLQGASLSETNENVEEHLQLRTEYNSHYQNEVSSQKEMFLEGFDTNGLVPDFGKEEQLPQMQAASDDLRGSKNFINFTWENGNALEELEALRKKYIMLEDEVQELREKSEKYSILSDAKPKGAQNLEIELKEMQSPTLVLHAKTEDMQDLQAQIKELQGIVQDLQKENIKLKGECTDGRTLKFKEELSHIKEPASTLTLEEASLALQEEKEVVVDEVKSSANGIHNKVGQEIELLQKGNRKYWRRLNSATQQVEGLKNTIQDLQQKLSNLKQENKNVKDDRWTGIEYSTIEKELREVQEELLQLLEHYNELEKDVKYGFSSVNRIQEEMGSLKGVHSEDTNEEIDPGKLYEEIRILREKNSKIADKLQAGSEKARGLEFEVRRIRLILLRFQEELEVLQNGHGALIEKVRVPLRAFLGKKEHVRKRRACCACIQPATHE